MELRNLFTKLRNSIFCSLLISSCAFSDQPNWYDKIMFKNEIFNFEFIHSMGYAYMRGADVGECFSTAQFIENGNAAQWYDQWFSTAKRLSAFAETSMAENNITSAQEAYLRASNYYRTASFFMVGPKERPYSVNAWKQSHMAFLKAISHVPYIKTVRIPYENTSMPGYFISSKVKNAPLLIVSSFDGTAEQLYFQVGDAAHRRGYNVLVFEGPGQGEMLKEQGIPMRFDWEHVMTPVVNFAEHLPNVDHNRITLFGLGLGAILSARAAAFEPRIKVLILNGGVLDMGAIVTKSLPKILRIFESNPSQFNWVMTKAMDWNVSANLFFNNAMWALKLNTPFEVLARYKQLKLTPEIIAKIKSNTLVIDSSQDLLFKEQPREIYNLLSGPKTLMEFTAEDTAQAHVQVGANAISNEKIFNWLNQVLNWHPLMIN